MSWQKCPACEGVGGTPGPCAPGMAEHLVRCTVCDGKKIISAINGLPPASKPLKGNDEPMTKQQTDEFFKQMSPFDDMNEDEIKFWATPYYDFLQERKKQKSDAIKNNVAYEPPPDGRVRI